MLGMDSLIELIHGSSFYEFAALLVLATFVGVLGAMLRQPLIIAFILVGLIVGPSALGVVQGGDEIALMAKLGIAILLFIVGLKLDLKLIQNLGSTAAIIGLIQIGLTILFGAFISVFLGFDLQTSFLIGVALSFSSTIIIIKILSDKREIDSMHGRIALGVLIVQDLAVVFSMIVLAAFSSANEGVAGGDETAGLVQALLDVAIYTAILITALALFMRFAALHVVSLIARNQELLLCFAIGWAVMLAALCDIVGLSKELGGLLAGISLASTPFREAIMSRLAALRDFLLLFFFISLGTQIDLGTLGNVIWPAIILSAFVMLFKPIIIMTLSGVLGYRKRTGFLAGLSLAQISEFSLIFSAMAFSAGLLGQEALALITLVAVITIVLSTYGISLSHKLYGLLETSLDAFEKKSNYREQEDDTGNKNKAYDIILFGLGRYGQAMADGFIANGQKLLLVDFNPEEIKKWRKAGHDAVYGDANDPEFFHTLPLKKAKWVVSALPQHNTGVTHEDPRLVILQALKDNKFKGQIAVAAHHQTSIERFQQLGASTVFLPFVDAANHAVEMVLSQPKPKIKTKA